jgi:predicted MFS family arabinose efflux permease
MHVARVVTATLMFVTVLTQLETLGWVRLLSLGLVLLGAPAPVQALSPQLWLVLLTSAVRGVGFGILTVCGATAVSLLVAPESRGRAVGRSGRTASSSPSRSSPSPRLRRGWWNRSASRWC